MRCAAGALMLDWQPRACPWPADPAAVEADRQRRIRLARDIWAQARPAAETVAERYLRGRDISIPIPPTVRFLPAGDLYALHPWSGERRPVMVAAVEHIEHGLVAVHRTWLIPDGSGKATITPQRITTGPVGGAAARLGQPDEHIGLPRLGGRHLLGVRAGDAVTRHGAPRAASRWRRCPVGPG